MTIQLIHFCFLHHLIKYNNGLENPRDKDAAFFKVLVLLTEASLKRTDG